MGRRFDYVSSARSTLVVCSGQHVICRRNPSRHASSQLLHTQQTNQEYDVECFHGYCYSEEKVLVKWKGYSKKHSSWEPIYNLNTICALSLLEYKKTYMRTTLVCQVCGKSKCR